jgi:hypothetical protein
VRIRMLWLIMGALSAAMATAGCTTDEVLRIGGQTLYNSGKYLCRQSADCDADGEVRPGATSNRR